MLWIALVCYLALSPVACLLIGRAIRVREVERPTVEPASETAVERPKIPA